jgi:hypothetical protein
MHDRCWGTHRPAPAAVLGAAVFLLLAIVSSASASALSRRSSPHETGGSALAAASPEVVVHYKGTITENFESPPPASSKSSDYRKAELTWDETVAGPVAQIQAGAVHWHINSLTGAVTDRQTEAL